MLFSSKFIFRYLKKNARVVTEAEQLLEISRVQLEEMKSINCVSFEVFTLMI